VVDQSARLLESVETLLDGSDYEVVDLVCAGSSRGLIVRVLVDRPGGVTIDDCARLSRAVGDHIDQHDLVPGRYVLELSSPGVDRPLRRGRDFARFKGETALIVTYEKVEGRHKHTGVLEGFDETREAVLLALPEGGSVAIPLGAVKKAHLKRDPWERRPDAPAGRGKA
jgi:ribosome maturation factor RimP